MFYSQRTVEVNIRPHLNVGRKRCGREQARELTKLLTNKLTNLFVVRLEAIVLRLEAIVLRLEAIVVRLEAITFSLNCLEFAPVQVPVVDDLLTPLVEVFDLLLDLVVFLFVGIVEPKLEHEYKTAKIILKYLLSK